MDLLHRFQEFLRSQNLLSGESSCLLAVSGGLDSMVLCELFLQTQLEFGIAHANFQLRGAESDQDETFVQSWALRHRIKFFSQGFETEVFAAEEGLSIQMAARKLRYDWLEQIRATYGFEKIATGHHLNDSVETAVHHLIRGTGLTGLTGIPQQNGAVIRPLLFASRAEILAFAQENNLTWREDSSNAQLDYTRNAIRQQVLPPMAALNPAFLAGAAKTIARLRAADANLNFLLGQLWSKPDANGERRLDKALLEQLPAPADALFDLLQPLGFTAEQARQVVDSWDQPGTEWLGADANRLVMDRDHLLLATRNNTEVSHEVQVGPDDLLVRLPDGSALFLMPASETTGRPDDNWESVLVPAPELQFPLLLRHWKPGDVFQPYGLNGKSQKIQDFFTNHKLSRLEKEKVWILEDQTKRIIWVLGMRLDERFKPSPDGIKLLKFTWVRSI